MGKVEDKALADDMWNLLKDVWPEIAPPDHRVCAVSLRVNVGELPVLVVERYMEVPELDRMRKYIERWEVKRIARDRANPPEEGYQADSNEVAAADGVTGVLRELAADLAKSPTQLVGGAVDFEKLAPDLCEVDFCVTEGAFARVDFKPTALLLDLAAAARTGNLDEFFVKHPQYLVPVKTV